MWRLVPSGQTMLGGHCPPPGSQPPQMASPSSGAWFRRVYRLRLGSGAARWYACQTLQVAHKWSGGGVDAWPDGSEVLTFHLEYCRLTPLIRPWSRGFRLDRGSGVLVPFTPFEVREVGWFTGPLGDRSDAFVRLRSVVGRDGARDQMVRSRGRCP